MKSLNIIMAVIFVLFNTACARPRFFNGASVSTFAGACGLDFKTQGLCGSIDWAAKQTDETAGTFILKIWNGNSPGSDLAQLSDLTVAQLKVFLWMPSMGHGSMPVSISRLAPGVFSLSNVWFSMPGEWNIHFQILNLSAEVIDEVVLPYRF